MFEGVNESVSFLGNLCLNMVDSVENNWFGLSDCFGGNFVFARRVLSIEVIDVE